MKCTNCGTEFDKGSFCPECGTRVVVSDTSESNPQIYVSNNQFAEKNQQPEKKPANEKVASNGVRSLIFGLVAIITSGALIIPEILGLVFAKKAKENGKMNKAGKAGFVCSIISIILCVAVSIGLIVYTIIAGDNKSLSLLQEQSLKEYGNDVTIGEAVTALFDQPSWGTGDGTTEEDGTRKLILHGTDRNENRWIIAFRINDEMPENWQFTITQFNDEYNVDLYGSDLLMQYFACGEEKYLYAFNNIFCCGDKHDRNFKASDVWDYMLKRSENDEDAPTLASHAGDFIGKYDELFPCEESWLPGELFDESLTCKAVKKNVNKHADKLMLLEDLYVVDVSEFDIGNGNYSTMIFAMDNELNVHFIIYMDEIDLYEDDIFSAAVVPIGSQLADDDDGTEVMIILYAAVSISDDVWSIKKRIAMPEERYEYALSYLADRKDIRQELNDEVNTDINTYLTEDDYRNAVLDYLAERLGGTHFYDWGLELSIELESNDAIIWSWAAGGGYGKLIQSKYVPSDIQESDDVAYDDMYSYQYNGSSAEDCVDLEGTYDAEMARCIITMYDTQSESGACGYVDFAGYEFYAQGELYSTKYAYEYYVITDLNDTFGICFDNNGESFDLVGKEYLMDSQIHYIKEK